jgi:hypothetical protein
VSLFNTSLDLSSQKKITTKARRGLLNLGQTCFLNVVLQSFAHNPLLRNYFLSDKHNSKQCKTEPTEPCTCCEMDKLFTEVCGFCSNFIGKGSNPSLLITDIFGRPQSVWTHHLPGHHLARIRRTLRLRPTRRTRILHLRAEPNSLDLSWFNRGVL